MTDSLYKLSQVLESAEKFPDASDLFLPKAEQLSPNTKCAVLLEDPEEFDFTEETLLFAEQNSLTYNIGIQIVQDVVSNARMQKVDVNAEELVQALEYYLDNDAFYDFGNLYG